MKTFRKTLILGMVLFYLPNVVFADAASEKVKAATCISCHGVAGISNNDIWPNLAGQKRGYLIKQIKAFRDGDRNDPMMAAMVKSLSDDDVNNLADFYSQL